MALIKCPECGKEISEYAPSCLNCGFPLDRLEKARTEKDSSQDAVEEERTVKAKESGKGVSKTEMPENRTNKNAPKTKKEIEIYRREWNKQNYKRINVYIRPETKERWEEYLNEHGYKSLNSFVIHCVEDVIVHGENSGY